MVGRLIGDKIEARTMDQVEIMLEDFLKVRLIEIVLLARVET